ncbi:hypothetical protein [Gimesia fumaroli]|uniref:Knr4/Smi1-like domain-containing protein n=1 Tax=Gimesia fumaroli TaxID=2527976 RepID=A0A518ICS7_9PLAN|nr:hypothetical protein [Gimesia fumaroli]QDV50893.1 hypothetical protein Enr17x_29380 [Gimesia fumaroli]
MENTDSKNPLLVTDLLHPREIEFDSNYPREMHPKGYVEFIAQHGVGSFCDGLSVHSAGTRAQYWTEASKFELLVEGMQQGGWKDEIINPTDLKTCMVIAGDDNGYSYVTCERFGPTIFGLPHDDDTVFRVGDSLSDLFEYYCQRQHYSFPFFDPWPHCYRRCAIGFVVPPDIGFDTLLNRLNQDYGLAANKSAAIYDTNYFQDRFIPALRAKIGFYFCDDRPPEYRLPNGSISVTMILDVDSLDAAADLKSSLTGSREFDSINYGQGCVEHRPETTA